MSSPLEIEIKRLTIAFQTTTVDLVAAERKNRELAERVSGLEEQKAILFAENGRLLQERESGQWDRNWQENAQLRDGLETIKRDVEVRSHPGDYNWQYLLVARDALAFRQDKNQTPVAPGGDRGDAGTLDKHPAQITQTEHVHEWHRLVNAEFCRWCGLARKDFEAG